MIGKPDVEIGTLNGENWGVYANVQQYNKNLLKDYFENADGLRVKCANNPGGPGLQYMGPNPGSYTEYEIKNDGGFANPYEEVLAICNAVDNTPGSQWEIIDQVVAIDPSIWTVVMENLLGDEDSYVNKGCDFMMYQNPIDGRTHIHQTDGNECFTEEAWPADLNFNSNTKPFLKNVLGTVVMRGRYFAHLREALQVLDPVALDAEFAARRALISAAVQADPKKLYSFQAFNDNFTVSVPGVGLFGAPVVGLQEYYTTRLALLMADPEVTALAPSIQNVAASSNQPGVNVFITADVTSADPLGGVNLFYRPTPSSRFLDVPMLDDGLSGDGAAGDGVFGVLLPVVGVGGLKVDYYVAALALNPFRTQKFEPARTELAPLQIAFQGGTAPSDVLINEFLARNNTVIQDPSGSFEDFIELYNKGVSSVDLSGMYMSDSLGNPTKWQIPAGTSIAAGQTLLIWADNDVLEGPLHAAFKLSTGGEEIGLWAADGLTLLDSVVFGPQEPDVSTGLLDDGGLQMVTFVAPTPDAFNNGGCGLREFDQLDPLGHTLGLSTTGSGAVGSTVIFTASGFLPGSPAAFLFDFAPAYLPVGGMNIVGLMGALGSLTFPTDGSGSLILPIAIPGDPFLVGVDLYFQAVGSDPLGVLAGSNAVHLSICP